MLTIIVTTSFILALLITFLNGMNDSANSISTVIVTYVLSPKKAVLWAVLNGITEGTSETTFSPDEDCTRAQTVTFLYRCLSGK